MAANTSIIDGYCPMGCGQTLFVGAGGYITCSWVECPRPDALSEIIGTDEPHHLVALEDDGFSIVHPLRERLDNELLSCDLNDRLAALDGPPLKTGNYRVITVKDASTWTWIAVK